jgi:hypothetical protein
MNRPRLCTECWSAGMRDVLAIATTVDGDDICLWHIRELGIDPDSTTVIAQPASAAPILAARTKALADLKPAESEKKEMSPTGIPTTPGRLCTTCKTTRLRKDSVGDTCAKCWKESARGGEVAPAKAQKKPRKKAKVRDLDGNRVLPGPSGKIEPTVLAKAVSINVTEAWLDGFWKLLSFEQKASLISTQPVLVANA